MIGESPGGRGGEPGLSGGGGEAEELQGVSLGKDSPTKEAGEAFTRGRSESWVRLVDRRACSLNREH